MISHEDKVNSREEAIEVLLSTISKRKGIKLCKKILDNRTTVFFKDDGNQDENFEKFKTKLKRYRDVSRIGHESKN